MTRKLTRSIRSYLTEKPTKGDADHCARCGQLVPGAQGIACLCWMCTEKLAERRTQKEKP